MQNFPSDFESLRALHFRNASSFSQQALLMSKSKLLIPKIKNPLKTLPKPSPKLLKLAHKIPQILKTPNWEQTLNDKIQEEAEIPSLLSQIPDPASALAFFHWAHHLRSPWAPPPDSPSYSALLKNLAHHNLFSEIDSTLKEMETHQISPSPEAFSALIGAYSRAQLDDKAIDLFSSMNGKIGSFPDVVDCNCLLKLLVEKGRLECARKLYDEMLERGVADNYSTCMMVRGFCLQGRVDGAKKLMEDRWGPDCIPNVVFYNTLIDGYFRIGEVRRGYAMFREMEVKGFLPTVVSYGVVINGFVKNRNFPEVNRLINEMKVKGLNPNVEIYNSIIYALCKHGSIVEGKAVLRRMIGDGCELDILTYNVLICGLCRDGKVREAEQLLREAIRRNLIPNALSYTPLIHGYCKQGEAVIASNFIIEMMERGHKPDIVTYGALIHGLVVIGEVNEALVIREKMIERGVVPDANIYNVLINGLCKKGMLPTAKMLLAEMFDRNILLDQFVYATLIDGFVRNGDIDEAKKVFEFMGQRGIRHEVVVFNAMIKGYCKHGMMTDAISHVNKMRQDGFLPDEFTYTTILDGYVKLSDLDGAFAVFGDMVKRKCNPNVVTYTALINGFCREGQLGTAETLFKEMKTCGLVPNVVTYSILIGTFCKDNKITKAAAFFQEMLLRKCPPNDVTFNYLINGLTNSISALDSVWKSDSQEHSESVLLNVFMNMISDRWDYRTAAYNAIIFCLCKHQMLAKGLDLRGKMLQKGCLPDSITFLSLLHGICLDGRSGEWNHILTCDFQRNELETALAYTQLFDKYINQGASSEMLSILYSLVDDIKMVEEK